MVNTNSEVRRHSPGCQHKGQSRAQIIDSRSTLVAHNGLEPMLLGNLQIPQPP